MQIHTANTQTLDYKYTCLFIIILTLANFFLQKVFSKLSEYV